MWRSSPLLISQHYAWQSKSQSHSLYEFLPLPCFHYNPWILFRQWRFLASSRLSVGHMSIRACISGCRESSSKKTMVVALDPKILASYFSNEVTPRTSISTYMLHHRSNTISYSIMINSHANNAHINIDLINYFGTGLILEDRLWT